MAATNSQHGFDAVIKSTKMGPTDILQPEQRVETLKLTHSYYMLHISCVICDKILCYPHQNISLSRLQILLANSTFQSPNITDLRELGGVPMFIWDH